MIESKRDEFDSRSEKQEIKIIFFFFFYIENDVSVAQHNLRKQGDKNFEVSIPDNASVKKDEYRKYLSWACGFDTKPHSQ